MEEHPNEILKHLARIEHELKSLRWTFGIGIVIVALFLTAMTPTLIRLVSSPQEVNAAVSPMP